MEGMENSVKIEGRLCEAMPRGVFYAKDQLRVRFELAHVNPFSGAVHRFLVEARGGSAKSLFNDYAPDRAIKISARLKAGRNNSVVLVVQNYAMLDNADFAMDENYSTQKQAFMDAVEKQHAEALLKAEAAPDADDPSTASSEEDETDSFAGAD